MFSWLEIAPFADVLDYGGEIDIRRQHFFNLRLGLEQHAAIRSQQIAR